MTTTYSFSQNTSFPKVTEDSLVVITPAQLKLTNLIFLEHNNLKIENELLNQKIDNYKLLTSNLKTQDSLMSKEIVLLHNELRMADFNIATLEDQVHKQKNTIKEDKKVITGLTFSLVLAILISVLQ